MLPCTLNPMLLCCVCYPYTQLLAEDSASTMPDILDVLRRRPDDKASSAASVSVAGESAVATSRWLSDAIQQYLSQQPVLSTGKKQIS